jgi:transposase-like protein
MSKKRRQHNAAFKAKVALDALKNIETVHAIAARHGVHPTQVSQWKKELGERLPELFARGGASSAASETQEREKELFEEIGRLKMELEWLKKKAGQLER